MADSQNTSPFHRGERDVQTRLGVREQVEALGQRFIWDYLPDEHREFYAELPYLLLGSVDVSGRPWASMLVGQAGFVQSPDPRALTIRAARIHGDPLSANLTVGAPIGVLGIQFPTRRRNRLTAKVADFSDTALTLHVDQTFGNCPQYIQARDAEFTAELEQIGTERPSISFDKLGQRARRMIESADNFYIATVYADDRESTTHGADVSHRGGKPGFVRIEDERTLVFPDFSGNHHYNTIGNITLNPLAGLLFINFDNGDALYLTCRADILWDSEEKRAFSGAERLVRFTIDEGLLVENAIPIRWRFVDYSPILERTGSWEEVDATLAERRSESQHRPLRVIRVERESSVITSFFLQSDDGQPLTCHKAGQFLPIEICPNNDAEVVRRTYTISNAPNGEYYRLSIKREPAPDQNTPPGLASNYFHENVRADSVIRAYPPRGQFTLTENSVRPVVLLSGGVGITPMISMLEQLHSEAQGCGCRRPVWFVHGAVSSREHAFSSYVRELATNWPCLTTHFVHSAPLKDDRVSKDYDTKGFITIDLLKSLLPLDDYDYYFCGPPPFMKSLYAGLKDLNVLDERIHYEFFGPGVSLLKEEPGQAKGLALDAKNAEPVSVRFARSDISTRWDPSKGTLLDLAESEGLSPIYSCRSGICATCQTQVAQGEVGYINPPVVEPECGTALICSAYPTQQDKELILDL